MKSLRWRIALWFAVSLFAVLAVFFGITYTHLVHELRVEKWERTRAEHAEWALHGNYSQAEVDDIAGELWRLSLLYAIPVAVVALGIGYYLARRSLQPVSEMNAQLQAIGAQSLDQRVKLRNADGEFRAIEAGINALLARLDGSFRQLTEYSAQVAHELRTPLTLLRLQVEEAAGQIDPALAESLQEELRRLSDFVDQSLLLAKAEQGGLVLNLQDVPLRATVMEMIEVYELLARSENRTVEVHAPEELIIRADPRTLRQILHNLLTNALRHGSGGLTVQILRDGSDRVLRVENALATHPVARGTGLGLRIVRALAGLHPKLTFSAAEAHGRYVAELRWS